MEPITLTIASPLVKTPGLDKLIVDLRTASTLIDSLSGKSINIKGLEGGLGAFKGLSDYARMAVESFDKLGNQDFGRQLRSVRSFSEELHLLDAQAAKLQASLAGAPTGAVRGANPAVAKKVADLETALASVNLRRNEIRQGLPQDAATQAGFDREARGVAAAEQSITGAANASTAALEAQGAAVSSKTGQLGELSGAARGAAAAERDLAGASGQSALMSERWKETAEGRVLVSQKFRESIGTTRTALGEEGKTILENTNFIERHAAAFQKLDRDFANKKVNIPIGTPEHIALLKSEAEGTDNLLKRMKAAGLENETLFQQRAKRQALLETQASRLAEKEARTESLGAIGRFEARRGEFAGGQTETRRSTVPGGYVETTGLSGEVNGLRQAITLRAQYDAQGRLITASTNEMSRSIDASGRTTQNSLLGTIGMAAKFIAVYRGIDLVVRGLEAGGHAAIEFERKMATLQIVFHGTKEEANELGRAVLGQAAALGQDGIAALDVATDFARFGLNQAEVLEAVRVASVAANVAQLDLAQSGKYLQAIYSGYQLNVGQLAGVLGSLDTVSHNYNVTNQQLLDGLSRVAPLAKQAGVSLNELIGYEAVITGRTARPGSEAGNAIKALISRLSKTPVQGTLQDIAGISVRDESGEMKQAPQIINELYLAYQNLGRAEQQELLIKVAGTQQASRIAALMDGYIKSQRLSIDASRDLGRAERENIAVRATLSSQLGTLSTEWERFWVASAGAGHAAGLQGNLTETVKLLSNTLAILTAIESLGGGGEKAEEPKSRMGQFLAGAKKQLLDGFMETLPFNLGGAARKGNEQFEDVTGLAKRLGLGDVFVSETEKSSKALIEFNAQVDRLEHAGEAQSQTGLMLKTIDRRVDTATAAQLEAMFREAAHVAAPRGDVRTEEKIRGELNALAKEGDYLALHARLRQLAAAADAQGAQKIQDRNRLLDGEIARETRLLELEEERRRAAGQRGDRDEVERLGHEIDQREAALAALEAKRRGKSEVGFPEAEEPYGFDPDAAGRRSADLEARFKGIEELSRGYAHPTASKSEEINRQIDELNAKEELLNQRQATSNLKGRDAALARDEYRTEMQTLEAEKERLGIMREYAGLQDRITEGSRLGRIQIEQYKTGRNETEELLSELKGISGIVPSESGPLGGKNRLQELADKVFRARDELANVELSGLSTPGGRSKGVNDAYLRNDYRQKEIEAERAYYAEKERIQQSAGRGTGVDKIEGLIGTARNKFVEAGKRGDKEGQAAAQAEVLQLGNELERIRLSLEERRYKIAADIVNERRKENEEATKSLLLAGREDQLRAVLVAKYVQQRGGKGFSNEEFQFLDKGTKEAVTRFNPQSGPPGLPTRSRDLEQEQQLLLRNLNGISGAIKRTTDEIENTLGRKLITSPPQASGPGGTVPSQFQPPPINLQFADQYGQMIASMTDLVTGRLDVQIAQIRSETREFLGTLRLANAQGAGTNAI